MPKRIAIPVVAIALVAAGCGGSSSSEAGASKQPANPNAAENSPPGDIPDNQAFVVYRPPQADYSVKVPEGWGRRTTGKAVTFSDKLNSVTMVAVPAGTKLPAGQNQRKVATVTRKAGKAQRVTYLAPAKPNPVTGKRGTDAVERYVFHHGKEEVVLTLAGPKGADNVDPWRIVSNSVTFEG
jgi:hypothetical protein